MPRHSDSMMDAVDREEQRLFGDKVGHTQQRKILDEVFDERTLKAVHKLMNDGLLYVLDFPISTGKEATVFCGLTRAMEEQAVKIYRVGNATFNSIRRYIQDDPRFRRVGKDRRSVIHAWAMKEYKNLERMRAAGAHVPRPVRAHENILIMEYLFNGDNHDPAPLMRNAPDFDAQAAFDILREDVRKVVAKGRLVHGDLSEYNVLMVEGVPYIIDVGQATVLDHPQSREFLRRDAANIARFFKRYRVEGADEKKLYAEWTEGVSFEAVKRTRTKGAREEE